MQKLISTKLVRKIVRSLYKVEGTTYTDKTKANNNLRNVSFFISKTEAAVVAAELRVIMQLLGYTNKVKVTTSKEHEYLRSGGFTYLRINNAVLD